MLNRLRLAWLGLRGQYTMTITVTRPRGCESMCATVLYTNWDSVVAAWPTVRVWVRDEIMAALDRRVKSGWAEEEMESWYAP